MKTEQVLIRPPFIKLQDLLKFAGACETGGQAKELIQQGYVTVNGQVCTQRGKKLFGGEQVCIDYQLVLQVTLHEDL